MSQVWPSPKLILILPMSTSVFHSMTPVEKMDWNTRQKKYYQKIKSPEMLVISVIIVVASLPKLGLFIWFFAKQQALF
jgi:hypothetical protein